MNRSYSADKVGVHSYENIASRIARLQGGSKLGGSHQNSSSGYLDKTYDSHQSYVRKPTSCYRSVLRQAQNTLIPSEIIGQVGKVSKNVGLRKYNQRYLRDSNPYLQQGNPKNSVSRTYQSKYKPTQINSSISNENISSMVYGNFQNKPIENKKYYNYDYEEQRKSRISRSSSGKHANKYFVSHSRSKSSSRSQSKQSVKSKSASNKPYEKYQRNTKSNDFVIERKQSDNRLEPGKVYTLQQLRFISAK